MKYTFFNKIKNSTKPYHILILQSSITSWPEILQKRSMYIERTSDHLRGGFDLVEQPGQITRFVASLSTVLSWLLAGQRGTTTENSNIRVCAQPSVVFYTAHVKKIGSSMSRRWGKMSGVLFRTGNVLRKYAKCIRARASFDDNPAFQCHRDGRCTRIFRNLC